MDEITLKFKLTRDDLAASIGAELQRCWILRIIQLILLYWILGIVFVFVSKGTVSFDAIQLLLFFFFLGVMVPYVGPFLFVRLRSSLSAFDEQFWRFNDSDVFYRGTYQTSTIQWSYFRQVSEDKRFIRIFVPGKLPVIIPLRAFETVEQQTRFRDLLQRRITVRRKAKRKSGVARPLTKGGSAGLLAQPQKASSQTVRELIKGRSQRAARWEGHGRTLEYTTLVVIFRPKLMLALSATESTPVLQLDNQVYVDSTVDFDLVFYDWLRSDTKEVVGVRFGIGKLPNLAADLNRFPYLRVTEPWDIEVFFTSEQEYADDNSRLQDFTEFRILQSANGEYAIAFSTNFLDDADIKRLRTFDVAWETPEWAPE